MMYKIGRKAIIIICRYITGKSYSTENYYNERTLICQVSDDDNENL